jgi:DNA-binding transcriptional ArsR family regulator
METTPAVRALAALAQETRLEVFRRLVAAGPEGLRSGDIARALGVPAPTMSHHLAQLSDAGLAMSRRSSREVYYAPNIDGIRALVAFLTDDCCQGRPELCAPQGRTGSEIARTQTKAKAGPTH